LVARRSFIEAEDLCDLANLPALQKKVLGRVVQGLVGEAGVADAWSASRWAS
jgi:hypothetical protein